MFADIMALFPKNNPDKAENDRQNAIIRKMDKEKKRKRLTLKERIQRWLGVVSPSLYEAQKWKELYPEGLADMLGPENHFEPGDPHTVGDDALPDKDEYERFYRSYIENPPKPTSETCQSTEKRQ